jgi:predicted RNA-binding Zn-ribbon protein involved in translation (DUF1610 family)
MNTENFNQVLLIGAISIAALVIILATIRYWRFMKHEHFVCPKCGFSFKPKVHILVFSENAGEGKIIKCPKCGEKEYMEPVKDEKS